MEARNRTFVTEFILLGFSNDLSINICLCLIFSVTYLITCVGNFFIFCIIIFNPHIHTPMYYFLANLSFLDLCYSSTVIPRILADLFSIHRIISGIACAFQLYIVHFLGGAECLLLALMAYDRYVAICLPLYYINIMSWRFCYGLTITIYIGSFLITVLPSLLMHVPICNPNYIDHFMCELLAILKLACENIFTSRLMLFFISLFVFLVPFMLILISYIYIISSILKIDSTARRKAFSTCSSHLTVVILFYVTAMVMYIGPSSMYSPSQEKYVAIVYFIITPMLNPFIYSLKNREVTESFNKLKKKYFSQLRM